ncbi:TPA: hypothetical protein RMT52_002715 [Escherichia coli]|nr:hypothetical protein [Escherichia coli]
MKDFEIINGLGLNHLRNHNDYSANAILRYQSSDVRDAASFSPSGDYPVTDGLTACASTTK